MHACAMPARVHRERMPCGSLRESSVYSRLLCLLVCIDYSPLLIPYGLHGGCAQAPLNIPNIPPCPLSQATTIRGGLSPQSWARGVDTYDWRAAAPTLVDFVLIASFCMHHWDPPPILLPTQDPHMQPPPTRHSRTPYGMSAHLINLFRNIPLRVLLTPVRESARV